MKMIFKLLSTILKIPLLFVLLLIYLPIDILDILWTKIIEKKSDGECMIGSSLRQI